MNRKLIRTHTCLALISLMLSACQISSDGTLASERTVTTFAAFRTSGALSGLAGIVVDPSGSVFVSERETHSILKITPNGATSVFAGTRGHSGSTDGRSSSALLSFPTGLTSDGAGNIYVADTGNSLIRKITPDGMVTSLCAVSANAITVTGPSSFVISSGHAVLRVTVLSAPQPCRVELLAGDVSNPGFSNGSGAYARFNGPWDLAVDASGSVLVADSGNHSIRKISPLGMVSTLAGPATRAQLNTPYGVTVDASGNIFVADSGNHTIRQIMPDGTVQTLAGRAGVPGNTGGTGPSALFNDPVALAVDRAGNLYVSDYGNNSIRKLSN